MAGPSKSEAWGKHKKRPLNLILALAYGFTEHAQNHSNTLSHDKTPENM